MKTSKHILSSYNVFKELKDSVVGINLIEQIFFSLEKDRYKLLIEHKNNVDSIRKINEPFYQVMMKLGVIIPEEDDKSFYEKSLFSRRMTLFRDPFYRLTINPTLNCNFSCWYCYEQHTKRYISKEILTRILKLITYILKEKQIQHFHLDWFGGEPLLCYSTAIEPITLFAKNECHKYGIKFTSGMTTNGYLISDDKLDFFKKVNMNSFQITLDGPKYIHDVTRHTSNKVGSYDKIVENIHLLAKKMNPENLCLRINYTLENLPYIEEIIHSFDQRIRHRIKVLLQQVWQDEINEKVKIEDIYKLKELFKNNGFKVEESFLNKNGEPTCYADTLNQAVINYDGRVFKCTAINFEKEKEDGYLTESGNIHWNTALYNKLLYVTFENQHCKRCTYLPICYGPCHKKIFHYLNGNDFEKFCFKHGIEENLNFLIKKFSRVQRPYMPLDELEKYEI